MEATLSVPAETTRVLRVLVVDDNRDAADSLCLLLRLWGYECQAAYDGATGMTAASSFRPDCLVLDIGLPLLDGYAVAQQVRQQPGLDRAKLIALTAYSDARHVRRAREVGFDFHLVKPADPSELERILNMLNELIQLAGKTEELARQNVVLAGETKELLQEVKADIQDVKQEVQELKQDLQEVKESLAEPPEE
jgi:CheY-like chemotaxis protein